MQRYVVLKSDDEEPGYTVEIPSLPGCITEGDTIEEALHNAREAIAVYVESLAERGLPIPPKDEAPAPSSHEFVTLLEVDLAATPPAA